MPLTLIPPGLLPIAALLPPGAGPVPYLGSTAPAGWVLASGRTIGNLASLATERANADTKDLFVLLWNSMSNALAPVSGGRGANAEADFAADKTIVVPDLRGRVPVGKDDMGGVAAGRLTMSGGGVDGATLGASGGAQNHQLTISQIPVHSHSVSDPGHDHSQTAAVRLPSNGNNFNTFFAGGGNSIPTSKDMTGITLGNTGGGTAHNNVQPVFVTNVIIKL